MSPRRNSSGLQEIRHRVRLRLEQRRRRAPRVLRRRGPRCDVLSVDLTVPGFERREDGGETLRREDRGGTDDG